MYSDVNPESFQWIRGGLLEPRTGNFLSSHGSGEPRRFSFRFVDLLLKNSDEDMVGTEKAPQLLSRGFYSSKSTSGGRRPRSKTAVAIRHIPLADPKPVYMSEPYPDPPL